MGLVCLLGLELLGVYYMDETDESWLAVGVGVWMPFAMAV
jgi:hypothetical protein